MSTLPLVKGLYHKRQRDKIWLPTHIWHSKRFHMTKLWGYAIPNTANDKNYRPSHRALTQKGCVAFDSSYFGSLLMRGREDDLKKVLKETFEPGSGAAGLKYSTAPRVCHTFAYKRGKFPDGLLGPAVVFWNGVGGTKTRQVLIHLHPSIFVETWNELLPYVTELNTSLLDCRNEMGSIDVLGPSSTETLQNLLLPRDLASKESQVWRGVSGTRPESLPVGFSLALSVRDPRHRFQTHKMKFESSRGVIEGADNLISVELFDTDRRRASVEEQESQSSVNKRKQRTPGLDLEMRPGSLGIPVFVFKRAGQGWTVLMPWAWVLPFWIKIVHIQDVKPGGLAQAQQLGQELGSGHFPNDWLGTLAGDRIQDMNADQRLETWKKKPKAKRTTFDSLTIDAKRSGEHGDPFRCDWTAVFQSREGGNPLHPQLLSPAGVKALIGLDAEGELFERGVIRIRLQLVGRGTPQDCARIYLVPPEQRTEWLKQGRKGIPLDPHSVRLAFFVTNTSLHVRPSTSSSGSWLLGITTCDVAAETQLQLCLLPSCAAWEPKIITSLCEMWAVLLAGWRTGRTSPKPSRAAQPA